MNPSNAYGTRASTETPPVVTQPPVAAIAAAAPATQRKSQTTLWIVLFAIGGGAGFFFLMLIGLVLLVSFQPAQPAPYGPATGGPGAYGAPTSAPWQGHGGGAYGEFRGEAEFGGTPYTSGTFDQSGQGNHVISQDGEVLNLPPY